MTIVESLGRRELSGGFRKTTNNRMELLSVISGLEALQDPRVAVTVRSDSRYVVDMINGGHAAKWMRNDWMRDRRHSVINPDLWKRLLALCQGRNIEFEWVRGHDGHVDNEQVDQRAVEARMRDGLPVDEGYETPALFPGNSLFG